jgi:ferredoxin
MLRFISPFIRRPSFLIKTFEVTLIHSTAPQPQGWPKTILCKGDMTILEAARVHQINLPLPCNTGDCLNCIGKVRAGSIDRPENMRLDPYRTSRGFTLTCVSRPKSNVSILINNRNEL